MTTRLTSPLVGMKFRPPAQAILASLAAGVRLRLRPEPENPVDPGAIAVYVASASIPESQYDSLSAELPAYGRQLPEILAIAEWQLGYVASSASAAGQKALASSPGTVGNAELAAQLPVSGLYDCRLGFDAAGRPLVLVEIAEG